jgi:hypothetical protein
MALYDADATAVSSKSGRIITIKVASFVIIGKHVQTLQKNKSSNEVLYEQKNIKLFK